MDELTASVLVGIAGVVLSVAFAYIPGIEAKYNALDGKAKSLIMLGSVALAAAGVFVWSCAGQTSAVSCDESGVWYLLRLVGTAVIANQATYSHLPSKPSGGDE